MAEAEAEAIPAEDNYDTTEGYLQRHWDYYDNVPKHGTILYKYGAYSWYFLTGAAIVSKEIYVLDAMAVTNWIPDVFCIMGIAYFAGPALSNSYASEVNLDKRNQITSYQCQQAVLDVKLKEITALEAQPAAFDQFNEEYRVALEEQAVAERRMAQQAVYEEALAQLETLAGKKQAEASLAGDIDLQLVLAHTRNAFQTDSKAVDSSVVEAIAALDGNTKKLGVTMNNIVDSYTSSPQFKADREAKLAELEQA